MSHKIKNPNQAIYIKAAESYSMLIMENGKSQIKTRPMKYFTQLLLENGWCKIHKSFMVNPLYIQKVSADRNKICLQNGEILPISRRNKKAVLQWRFQNC